MRELQGVGWFEQASEYEVGARISMVVHRSWLDIWWDRITTWRWHVPQMETRWFECTSTKPGSIWLMVDE